MRTAVALLFLVVVLAAGVGAYFYVTLRTSPSDTSGDTQSISDIFFGSREGTPSKTTESLPEGRIARGAATTTYTTTDGKEAVLIEENRAPIDYHKMVASATSTPSDCDDYCTLTVARAWNTDGTPRFDVFYRIDTDLFVVVLESEPLRTVRKEAEQALLRALNISEADLCSTRHYVAVPPYVNRFYDHKNVSFSFCPGAIAL